MLSEMLESRSARGPSPGTRRLMSDPKTVAQRTDRMIDRMLGGDRLALARLITQVENRTAALPAIMKAVYPRAHGADAVAATGPPPAGQATVSDRLTVL